MPKNVSSEVIIDIDDIVQNLSGQANDIARQVIRQSQGWGGGGTTIIGTGNSVETGSGTVNFNSDGQNTVNLNGQEYRFPPGQIEINNGLVIINGGSGGTLDNWIANGNSTIISGNTSKPEDDIYNDIAEQKKRIADIFGNDTSSDIEKIKPSKKEKSSKKEENKTTRRRVNIDALDNLAMKHLESMGFRVHVIGNDVYVNGEQVIDYWIEEDTDTGEYIFSGFRTNNDTNYTRLVNPIVIGSAKQNEQRPKPKKREKQITESQNEVGALSESDRKIADRYVLPAIIENYKDRVSDCRSLEELEEVIETLKTELSNMDDSLTESYIYERVKDELLDNRQAEIFEEQSVSLVRDIESQIANIRADNIEDTEDKLRQLKQLYSQISQNEKYTDLVQNLDELEVSFDNAKNEFFREHGDKMVEQIDSIIGELESASSDIDSPAEYLIWIDTKSHEYRERVNKIVEMCPHDQADLVLRLDDKRQEFEKKEKAWSERLRKQIAEKADKKLQSDSAVIKEEIDWVIKSINDSEFKTKREIEEWWESNTLKTQIESQIAEIGKTNSEAARVLEQELKNKIANAIYQKKEMLRAAKRGESGQMVMVGDVLFPVRKIDNSREEEHFVDLKPYLETEGFDNGQGEIKLRISNGRVKNVGLYDGSKWEDDIRIGALTTRDDDLDLIPEIKDLMTELTANGQVADIPSTVMSWQEYRLFSQYYRDWQKGSDSVVRRTYGEKKARMQAVARKIREDLTAKAEKKGVFKRSSGSIQTEYRQALDSSKEYQEARKAFYDFSYNARIPFLKRVDAVKTKLANLETTDLTKGEIPDWKGHWVVDETTQFYLSEMARHCKMQLDLGEGVLNLKGHAGTGKDVLVKMFCAKTQRPLFSMDCTKWTTEFELSEDVSLEAEDGTTQTIKVPSIVLNAIQTPGAVMYFNEFNSMPEQAQIFLHALFDEKRSLTLKTSSGKTIKADPSVIFMSSMNPLYAGTFDPQLATRSRMVDLEIKYPEFKRTDGTYSFSEAMRLAREVDSLADYTYDPDLSTNEFVKIWERYINNKRGYRKRLSRRQEYDLDVIFALVTFSNKLRDEFIKKISKSRESRDALPVEKPITGRELRRCAYVLTNMEDSKTLKESKEDLARFLIRRFFLCHIDNAEDVEKIKKAMDLYTTQKVV